MSEVVGHAPNTAVGAARTSSPGKRQRIGAASFFFAALVSIIVPALFVGGCSKSGPSGNISSSAFDSAPAETKQLWNDAMSAWKSHRYPDAANKFVSLQTTTTNLSQQQKDALTKAVDEFGQETFKKANDGDAEATKAVQAMNAAMSRRSGH